MTKKIDKYKVQAALVRSFFDAFSHGVIESQVEDRNEKTTPQSVKKLMLEHYEHIAPAFFDTMFFPLAAMNYKYEDIAALAREAQQRGDDMMALVRTACGNEAYYNAMVEEYKRNFSMLLAGKYLSNADHLEGYVRKAKEETEASVDSDRAIELTVRVVMFAYVRGLRQTGEGARFDRSAHLGQVHPLGEGARFDRSVHLGQVHPLRGATLFRLMLDAMNILLLNEAVDFADAEATDLASLFLKVCQTQHNFTVMTNEMDRTYSELMKE
ncbi:hypothetical protein [Leyella stercorea]|uniref:hypothetical protein n=1 Tax=Leyella stercorea TaxID=363265 RepID=UPI001A639EFC|nr:hypothetical protein [Leyella stercorea]MBL6516163.1 hypothetical protein [Leyella stercorea]